MSTVYEINGAPYHNRIRSSLSHEFLLFSSFLAFPLVPSFPFPSLSTHLDAPLLVVSFFITPVQDSRLERFPHGQQVPRHQVSGNDAEAVRAIVALAIRPVVALRERPLVLLHPLRGGEFSVEISGLVRYEECKLQCTRFASSDSYVYVRYHGTLTGTH